MLDEEYQLLAFDDQPMSQGAVAGHFGDRESVGAGRGFPGRADRFLIWVFAVPRVKSEGRRPSGREAVEGSDISASIGVEKAMDEPLERAMLGSMGHADQDGQESRDIVTVSDLDRDDSGVS